MSLPTYVEMKRSDGRRVFKPAFVARVVADVRSRKTTAEQAAKDFHIHPSIIYRWVAHNRQGKPPGKPANPVVVNGPSGKSLTLLEKAQAVHTSPTRHGSPVDAKIREEIELAVAYCKGEVSYDQLRVVLKQPNLTRFHVTPWLGRVLGFALKSGYHLEQP
jgi:transposase-like protein